MGLKEILNGVKSIREKLAEASSKKFDEDKPNTVSFNVPINNSRTIDKEKTANSTPAIPFKQEDVVLPMTQREGRVIGVKPVPVFNLDKTPVKNEEKIKPVDSLPEGNNDLFRKGIVHNENRGTIAAGKDPYQSVGPTGDLGKYQVSPETLATTWPEAWIGKKMTKEEFLNDPQAQETFFNEFIKVKDKYGVPDEDAAIMWHRGWGVLGNPNNESGKKKTFEEKKKDLFNYLNRIRGDEKSQEYLQSFRQGIST